MKKTYLPIPGAPLPALLSYLHSKLQLTEAFDLAIDPMLEPMTADKDYHCEKIEGIMRTAYWIHTGYAYTTIMIPDKIGEPVIHIVDVFGPGKIMLHADGFFNEEKTDCEFWLSPGTTFVPFTQQNFTDLRGNAPDANSLATCILAENATLSLIKSCMLKLPGQLILAELNRIFGKEIWQHFSQKQLAGYLGITENYISDLKAEGKLFS